MSGNYDGLDLWFPLFATQIDTDGKPVFFMRYDQKAFRCMICGVFFTASGPDGGLIQIPAKLLRDHLAKDHALALRTMAHQPSPTILTGGVEAS